MTCPACGSNAHAPAKYAPCCSRGCFNFHKRKTAVASGIASRAARVASIIAHAKATVKPVVQLVPPDPTPAPTLAPDIYRCAGCGRGFPDWGLYASPAGELRCKACHNAWKQRRHMIDDRATPGAPFEGGGVRVIRSTKSLS